MDIDPLEFPGAAARYDDDDDDDDDDAKGCLVVETWVLCWMDRKGRYIKT